MKKIFALIAVVVALCFLVGACFANTLSRDTDVFKTTDNGKMTIVDVLVEGTEYEQIDRLTAVVGTAFDSYYYTSSPIEWVKVAYMSIKGERIEGWIVTNPEVITGINMDVFAANTQSPQEGNNGSLRTSLGFVLCETLSLRSNPNTDSETLCTLPYGSQVEIISEQNEWNYVTCYNVNGEKYAGWVKGEYVLADPTYFQASVETPVYALPAAGSKRVGLLDIGATHPILGEIDNFMVISLRGACGFVLKP